VTLSLALALAQTYAYDAVDVFAAEGDYDWDPVQPDGWNNVNELMQRVVYVLYGLAAAGLLLIAGTWLWSSTRGHGGDDYGRLGKWVLGMLLLGGVGGIMDLAAT
jgi:hypothetical protein